MPDLKLCNFCKIEKSSSEFYKRSKGLQPYCKVCQKEKNKANYNKNAKKVCERTLEWQKNNPEKVKQIQIKASRKKYWQDPESRRQYAREYRKKNPDHYRHTRLVKKYNITLSEYRSMLDKQGGVCAICFKPEWRVQKGKILPLAVDHCHKTGKVRALLCSDCNKAVGLVHENATIAQSLVKYIIEVCCG